MMNNISIIIFLIFMFYGCKDNDKKYENYEIKVISDITNDYLNRNILNEILEPHNIFNGKQLAKPNIDKLDLKVYISDALLPIAQVKQDNEWMFNDNYWGTPDSAIFYGIINSENFNKLGYREFDKREIRLIKPFRQFEKSQEKVTNNESYTILNFSRVCFDSKKENGVVVVEYLQGFKSTTMNGYHMALLIRRSGDKWIYVSRK